MIGHVYFDRAFSAAYVPLLDAVYDNPATVDKLWEHILSTITSRTST